MFLPSHRSQIIAYGLLLVLFLVGGQFYGYYNARQLLNKESLTYLERTAKLYESHFRFQRFELERFSAIVRDDKQLQEYVFVVTNFDTGREVLKEAYEKQFGWLPISRIAIIDADGRPILGEENRDLFALNRYERTGPFPTTFYNHGEQGLELVSVSSMNYLGENIATVILTRALDKQWLMEQVSQGIGDIVIAVDDHVVLSTLSDDRKIRLKLTKNQYSVGGVDYFFVPLTISHSSRNVVRLWLGTPSEFVTGSLRRFQRQSMIQVLMGLIVTITLGWMITRSVERPLGYLSRLTAEIAAGRLPSISKSSDSSEFSALINKFADMVSALKDKDAEVARAHSQLKKTAVTDALTGLYNRRAFETSLVRIVENARHSQRRHAMCYIDLDNFKIVNDSCGHIAGDQLLLQVTSLIQARVRGNDVLARLGGDEFGLLISDVNEEQALGVAEDILGIIRSFRFSWEDKIFTIGASIGVVMIDEKIVDRIDVMRQADIACYTAKNLGRNRVHLYRSSDCQGIALNEEVNWLDQLNYAFRHRRFRLWYQDIALARHPEQVQHREILVRMENAEGKIIAPGAFVPVAERYGMAGDLDRWVIEATFRYLTHCPREDAALVYSINLSGLSLNDASMLTFIVEALAKYGVTAQKICFEITETAAITNLTQARAFIEQLKDVGCLFALDDFGTGVCSFQYLQQLSVDFIKIDGAFVAGLHQHHLNVSIVSSIQNIATALGRKTIAEYVLDDHILETVREIGVDYAQGYAIGPPRPLDPALYLEEPEPALILVAERSTNDVPETT